ncbi:MAG: Hpt domain-containing protein [Caulobacteraceae bacterium]
MTQANRQPFMSAGGVDPDVVARAEAALKSLSAQFSRWLQDEIDKLDAARAAVNLEGLTSHAGDALYTRAHDLKGLGGTYEFPIVTRAAASLCRVIDNAQVRAAAPLSLVDSHINAIKAMIRDGIRTDDHPIGQAMVMSLEDQVDAFRSTLP